MDNLFGGGFMNTEVSWVEHLYSYFLGRDICYIFSGGLFISIVKYAYLGEINLPKGLSLEVISFLMVSYFVGISISAIANIINISPKEVLPTGYSSFSFDQAVIKYYNERVLNQIERMIFMGNVGIYIGLSSLLGTAFMLILALIRLFLEIEETTLEYKLLAFSLLIFGIIMILDSSSWAKAIKRSRQELADEIAIKEKK